MKRQIDLKRELLNFEGEIIKDSDNGNMTVKNVLLSYIRSSHSMGLNNDELNSIYCAGVIIGQGEDNIILSTKEYNTLKKIIDSGKITHPNGQVIPIQTIEISEQIKEIIDSSKIVEELKLDNKETKE